MRGLALLCVAALLLSGCAGSDDAPTSSAGPKGASASLAQNDTLEAPLWKVGQAWDHRYTIGQEIPIEFLASVVVAKDEGASWRVASPDNLTAALHAVVYFPDLGSFTKDELLASDGERSTPWYDFPLSDGKTWRATEKNLDFNLQPVSYDLECTATLRPGANGQPTTYGITCLSGGNLRSKYDYDPSIGWFSEFRAYDPAAAAAEDAWDLRIIHERLSHNNTGTAYVSTATQVANHISVVAPDPSAVAPNPTSTFTLTPDHDRLLGFLFSFAATGVANTEIYDPMMRRVTGYQAAETPAGAFMDGPDLLFIDGIAGEWRIVSYGAGVATGGGFIAWGISETELTIG